MGLDCIAYKNLRQLTDDEIEYHEYKDEDGTILERYTESGKSFYLNPGFPHAAKDIREEAVYVFDEDYGWRAGSYSGYNQWRSWLATIAGWKNAEDAWKNGQLGEPFFELINFSDCEGTLGTLVCQKLLADFIKFQPKVNELQVNNHNRMVYEEWLYALELAAQNGAISFG